jgi:phage-related protein
MILTGGKYLSQCCFVHYKSHIDWPGIEPEPPLCHYTVPQFKDHISQLKTSNFLTNCTNIIKNCDVRFGTDGV